MVRCPRLVYARVVGELSCGAKCDAIDSSGCVEPVRDAGSPDWRDAARTQDAAVGYSCVAGS